MIRFNSSSCQELYSRRNYSAAQGLVSSVELHETLLLVVGFGIFASIVAYAFMFIRKKVYKDKVRTFRLEP